MQAFSTAMLDGLSAANISIRLIRPEPILARSGNPNAGLAKWLGYFDKYVLFPFKLRQAAKWADIVHICDHSNSMYTKYVAGKPNIVTCHDLLAIRSMLGEIPQSKLGRSGMSYQKMILSGLKKAQHIVCISNATRDDVCRIAERGKDTVDVVYNGLLRDLSPMPADTCDSLLSQLGVSPDCRYLLHVGGNQFYKNRAGLLEIYDSYRTQDPAGKLPLIMAGKPFTETLRTIVRDRGLQDDIRELQNPSDEQIRALYTRAEALIFPSLYEGFGLPILEAQACGCPVVTTNRMPMTEVGGAAAVYCDPEDINGAAETIIKSLASRNEIIEAGKKNISRFTRASMIEGYISVYTSQLKSPG
jgi:glycosyltransferase involved in cell wall biosynthesis